jgi:hypothetical protein
MTEPERERRGQRKRAMSPGVTTGTVPAGRYVIDFRDEGSLLWRVPASRETEPPKELVRALEEPPHEPEPDRSVLDRLADRLTDWTDKIERPTVILESLVRGRLPPGEVMAEELADLLGLLRGFVRAERLAEAIRLGRPLCRLCGLTLRWAMMVESLRLVLHAATALADTGTMAWAEHELGTLYLSIGDFERAGEHLKRARELRKQIGDQEGLASTKHNLGLLPRARRVPPFAAALTAMGLLLVIALVLALANPLGSGTSGPSTTGPSTTVTRASAGAPVASPSMVDFGTEDVGGSTPAESVALLAPARGAVTVGAVMITGAEASDFRLGPDSCAARRLSPGASCSVGVTFAPAAAGPLEATLSFSDGSGRQQVALSGTGARGVQVAVHPSQLNFGTLVVEHPSQPERVGLSNHGGGAVTLSSVKLTGRDSSDFLLSSDGCSGATVAPGASCSLAVTFTPSGAGARTATLSFDDDASGGGQQVSLSGAGMRAGGLTVKPGSLSFGSVQVGQTGAAQSATLFNGSSAPIRVGSPTLAGADPGDFAVTSNGCTGRVLAASASCTIGVRFAPTVAGSLSAMLAIAGQGNARAQEVALSGIGAGTVEAAVAPSTLNFGEDPYGQTTAGQSVMVSNHGSLPLAVQPASIQGSDAGDFTIAPDGCNAQTIAPGGSCSITVTFTPKAVGQRTATLTIPDDTTPSTQSVTLSGDGTGTPAATANPSPLDLSPATPSGSVTLTDSGSAPLSVGTVSLTGVNASEFQLSAGQCSGQTISPNSSCAVTVTFAPARTINLAPGQAVTTTQTSTTSPTRTAHAVALITAMLSFADSAASSPQVVTVQYSP